MKIVNRLIILTIVFNFLIPIGAGHGIGVLGVFEIFGLTELIQGEAIFNFIGTYEERLYTAAAIALFGQIVLLFAFFRKLLIQKYLTIYAGLFILFFSYFILTLNLLDSTLDSFSFWAGIPFVIVGTFLFFKTIQKHRLTMT